MSVAEPVTAAPPERSRPRRRFVWPLALAGLFAAALILRLIGLRTGLPYVYNADENSHFVPRAVGMFGHGFNPDYFINPPAYTYVVHFLFALRYGTDPASIGGAFAADPTGAFTIARAASATLGAAAVPLTAIAGARLFADRRVGFVAGARRSAGARAAGVFWAQGKALCLGHVALGCPNNLFKSLSL